MSDENLAGQIVLGTMDYGTIVDEQRGHALLDRFVEQGGTRFETADCYVFWSDPSGFGGQSEAVIGTWLRSRPGARDRVRLSTKVGHPSSRMLASPRSRFFTSVSLRMGRLVRWVHRWKAWVAVSATPRSVTTMLMRSCGVMSNAGLKPLTPVGVVRTPAQ